MTRRVAGGASTASTPHSGPRHPPPSALSPRRSSSSSMPCKPTAACGTTRFSSSLPTTAGRLRTATCRSPLTGAPRSCVACLATPLPLSRTHVLPPAAETAPVPTTTPSEAGRLGTWRGACVSTHSCQVVSFRRRCAGRRAKACAWSVVSDGAAAPTYPSARHPCSIGIEDWYATFCECIGCARRGGCEL